MSVFMSYKLYDCIPMFFVENELYVSKICLPVLLINIMVLIQKLWSITDSKAWSFAVKKKVRFTKQGIRTWCSFVLLTCAANVMSTADFVFSRTFSRRVIFFCRSVHSILYSYSICLSCFHKLTPTIAVHSCHAKYFFIFFLSELNKIQSLEFCSYDFIFQNKM